MKRKQTLGKCAKCSMTFSEAQMSRHLAKCVALTEPGFHVRILGGYEPKCWMHLSIPASARLSDLDLFLRDTWLECCGHMSCFRFPDEQSYMSSPFEAGDRDMNVKVSSMFEPKLRFLHEYDFGSTTELLGEVLEAKSLGGKKIQVLARNGMPELRCIECDEPASSICTECSCDRPTYLCKKCARKHECGEEMLLPVVNSPRMGVCGYTGPEG